jgi:multiple sugar transport system substrate-binding protein
MNRFDSGDTSRQTFSRRQLLRRAGIFAAGSAAASLLAACGGGGSPTAATGGQATQPAAGSSAQPTAVPAARGTATAAGAAGGSALGYTARPDTRGEITFWHFWGSPARRTAIRRVIGEFGQQYPNIKVNETFVPFADIFTRNIAAVAAGSGMPDVIVESRGELRTRAANQIQTSLAEFARRDGVTGDPFWKFTWDEATVNGEPYGLPYETDIRILYYNKAAFADAGLDPEKPPTNWTELEAFADKLDKKDGNKLERIGFYPLIGGVGLDSWAYCNGGDWQTADLQPTLNRKENVEALAWIKKWADRYGKSNVDAFRGSFGQGNQDGFMSGRMANLPDIQGYTTQLNFYNPKFETSDKKDLGYGVAALPTAPGQKPGSFSGGFVMANPRGSKNREQAWEFIKYMAFVGQRGWSRDTFSVPTIEKMAKEDPSLTAAPNWKFFVDAMSYGRPSVYNPYYPTMMGDLITPAQDDVLVRGRSPQEALDSAQQKAEQEIAKNRR